jgi:hypothetical protein
MAPKLAVPRASFLRKARLLSFTECEVVSGLSSLALARTEKEETLLVGRAGRRRIMLLVAALPRAELTLDAWNILLGH